MSTIYKFEDLLSFQDKNLASDETFDAWDIFGKFDPNKKRLDLLLGEEHFLEKVSSVLSVSQDEESISVTGNALDVINAILKELDKEENYTWPEIAATCFFLGRNLDVSIKKINQYLERKHNPNAPILDEIKESFGKIEEELKNLQSELELLRDAGII